MDNAGSVALARTRPEPAAFLQLLKPITWFPPMWAFGCGAVSAGAGAGSDWLAIGGGILLAGPMICATSQAVNDWFDRHVDAINEPERPIPSGRVPGQWGLYIACLWTLLSALLAAWLGPWVLAAALVGIALAWAYSAPPLRLKLNGWWGNTAVAACYEGLPWITGAVIVLDALPDGRVLWLAALYSLGAHGIMTLNDFKAVRGDRRMGVRSLPVQLGPARAARLACATMALPQLVVALLLMTWGRELYAAGIAALLLVQLALMRRLLGDPERLAPWYNATGVSLYVWGMLLSAFAVRPLAGAL